MFNAHHILAFTGAAVIFVAICLVIFLKIKNIRNALIFYAANIVFATTILYSLLLYVDEKTKQAELSDIKFARNLRTESVTITGRATNITKFPINKCFLDVTITEKVGGGTSAFDPKNRKNIQKGSHSVNYIVQVITDLPGHSYKDFSVSIPFPPNFVNFEFYHTPLSCI